MDRLQPRRRIALLAIALACLSCNLEQKSNSEEVDIIKDEATTKKEFASKDDLIEVFSPSINQMIDSTIFIKGKARGFWFFEASFPLSVYSESGNLVLQSYVNADSTWMTEDFVPFSKTIHLKNPPTTKLGTIVFHKANASGMKEHADSLILPIQFSAH